MIAARHLSRQFGDRSAVEDVTFDVKAVERESNKVDPPDPPSEVKVEW